MSELWGELAVVVDVESGIAAIEREQMTKPRPMDVEGPRLHQPSSKQYPPSSEPHPAESFAIDSLTLHTIKLIQHARKLKSLIQNAHQTLESSKSSENDMSSLPEAPAMPEYEGGALKHRLNTPVPFLPKNTDSDFCRGLSKTPPVIDQITCHQLLRQSVTAVTAQACFDSCSESVLDYLTDVCGQYFHHLTHQLRHAVDKEALSGSTGFQDVMEQVFEEMGVGSVSSLHHFYQKRVLAYHSNMEQSCRQLTTEYERLLNPDQPTTDDKSNLKVKDELVSDIQFPSAEEAEEMQDADQLLQLGEGIGLDINIVQESTNTSHVTEEEKADTQTDRKASALKRKFGSIDDVTKKKLCDIIHNRALMAAGCIEAYDGEDGAPASTELPPTPRMGSDAGDSIKDPGSVSSSDIMSPSVRSKSKKSKDR